MEDDVRYMFLVSTIGCVAVIALLALRITTNASFSLFSGVLIGFFVVALFLFTKFLNRKDQLVKIVEEVIEQVFRC
nr:hypothetical protein [Oscillochloris trichoides]